MGYPQKGRADYLELGTFNAVCSICGGKFKANQLKLHWQGMWRCERCWEIRQPQDFVRGIPDRQTPPWNQPPSESFAYICDLNSISAFPGYALPGCMLPGRAFLEIPFVA